MTTTLKPSLYNVTFNAETSTLELGFTENKGSNIELLEEFQDSLSEIIPLLRGSNCLKVTGPSTIVLISNLTHRVSNIVNSLAFYDPKLKGFIVTVSFTPEFQVGQFIPE